MSEDSAGHTRSQPGRRDLQKQGAIDARSKFLSTWIHHPQHIGTVPESWSQSPVPFLLLAERKGYGRRAGPFRLGRMPASWTYATNARRVGSASPALPLARRKEESPNVGPLPEGPYCLYRSQDMPSPVISKVPELNLWPVIAMSLSTRTNRGKPPFSPQKPTG